jgi:hypothetical protein
LVFQFKERQNSVHCRSKKHFSISNKRLWELPFEIEITRVSFSPNTASEEYNTLALCITGMAQESTWPLKIHSPQSIGVGRNLHATANSSLLLQLTRALHEFHYVLEYNIIYLSAATAHREVLSGACDDRRDM